MKVLLATDGSEQAEAAANEIVRQQLPANSAVLIISVVEPVYLPLTYPGDGVDMDVYSQIEKDGLEQGSAAVRKAAAQIDAGCKGNKLHITTEVFSGSPTQTILEEVEKFDADLIVVGSHGYGMVKRFLLGSVSHSVALHAACSVEIVRNRQLGNKKMKILLAIDGSEQSEAAVDEVARQHFPDGSEVRIISVIEPAYYPTTLPWEGIDMEIYKQIEKHALMRALETVQKASAKLQAVKGSRQLTITTKELSGSAKSVILEEADSFGADLIVVGSHGHGSVERFLLGSVSQAVALHATCSVEIVRSRKTQSSENTWD